MPLAQTGHPSPSLIAAYATGDLPAFAGLAVAVHAETCGDCSARIARIEAGCGQLLESMDGAALAPDALSKVLRRVDQTSPHQETPRDLGWLRSVPLPLALSRYRIGRPRWLKPGVCIAQIGAPRRDDWRAYVVRAEASTVFPRHEHPGTELVSVLSGAFHDGGDYKAGDFAENAPGTAHSQHVTPDGSCIALVAAEVPARWRGAARFIAPLYGL